MTSSNYIYCYEKKMGKRVSTVVEIRSRKLEERGKYVQRAWSCSPVCQKHIGILNFIQH